MAEGLRVFRRSDNNRDGRKIVLESLLFFFTYSIAEYNSEYNITNIHLVYRENGSSRARYYKYS